LNTSFSAEGVTILRVPTSEPVFAQVHFREEKKGKFNGQAYACVNHWASTFSVLKRK